MNMLYPTKIIKADPEECRISYLFDPPDGDLDGFEDRAHGFMSKGGGGPGWQTIESFIPDRDISHHSEHVAKGSWIALVEFYDPAIYKAALTAIEGPDESESSEEEQDEKPALRTWGDLKKRIEKEFGDMRKQNNTDEAEVEPPEDPSEDLQSLIDDLTDKLQEKADAGEMDRADYEEAYR